MKLNLFNTLVVCSTLSIGSLYAQPKNSDSVAEFYKFVGKYPFTVVLFYKTADQAAFKEKVAQLEIAFDRINNETDYRQAGMKFVKVKTDKKELEQLAKNYGIKTLPTIVLFQEGEIVRDEQGKVVMLKGFIGHDDLYNFIDAYVDDTDEYAEPETTVYYRSPRYYYRPYYRPYVGFGFGYPYYYGNYYPYSYSRPGFGIGFGFGI